MMTKLALVRAGYGSLEELESLDTPEYLDIVEFEMIRSDIEDYEAQRARNGDR